jgi:hypothetical protein
VRHRLEAVRLDRQSGLSAVERLDLALFINRQDHRMGRRIDIKPDNVGQLGGKAAIARALEGAQPVRLQFVRLPDALHRTHRDAGGRDYQEFRARRAVETNQVIASVKRSPKRTANWALAMDHSRGGMIHCFSERFKTHKTRRSKGGSYPLPHLYETFGLVRLTRLGRDLPWAKA